MVLLQIGSMPHELTLENMDRFAREVELLAATGVAVAPGGGEIATLHTTETVAGPPLPRGRPRRR